MLVERAGYEGRKLPDRVAQVDAQVKAPRRQAAGLTGLPGARRVI
jgi:hypothetical protein